MGAISTDTATVDDTYARALPELVVAWQAEVPASPGVLLVNDALAKSLRLDPAWLRSPAGVALLTGTAPLAGIEPVAMVYAGHQFGNYSPRLGDGRALLLGEIVDTAGVRRDLHLKGSGRTPFARGGDGLAAVGPMMREYVISEAMHALGVPTTRSLAVVATGTEVHREDRLPGAVLARVAASHLRVGTFQFTAATGDRDVLRRLADYAIERHHPDAAHTDNPYLALLGAVIAAQAQLVAQWMLLGFVHGVMNTDNMTISGETIDYGPCAFMEAHDAATVFSSIDWAGRYAYGNQPAVARWNLARFAETLLPLIDADSDQAIAAATEVLADFDVHHEAAFSAGLRAKLGLAGRSDTEDGAVTNDVAALQHGALDLLATHHVDHTLFFRALGAAARGDTGPLRALFAEPTAVDGWLARWHAAHPDPVALDRVNPIYIPRNYRVEEALAAATAGDLAPVTELLAALSAPFDERPGLQRYAEPAPADAGEYRTFCGT